MGPLTRLLRKSVSFSWDAGCQAAFEAVTEALITAPVLVMPFELIADARSFGIGAALLQKGHPIAYMCRKFSFAEQNYTVGEQ